MKIQLAMAAVALGLASVGCTSPSAYTSQPLTPHGEHAKFRADDTADGFVVVVEYARYQAFPETQVVAEAGRQELEAIAQEVAADKGRKIAPLTGIKSSSGRNIVSGITTWRGVGEAHYLP